MEPTEATKPKIIGLSQHSEEEQRTATLLCARLAAFTTKQNLKLVESANSNGLQAWRMASQRYSPKTHARCMALDTQAMTYRIAKNGEPLNAMIKWGIIL